jgi:hypothetical protein
MKMAERCRTQCWLSDKSLNFISFPLREHPRLETLKIAAQRGSTRITIRDTMPIARQQAETKSLDDFLGKPQPQAFEGRWMA